MNKVNFIKGVGKLKDRFGEKSFSKSFCDLLWEIVCDADDRWYLKTCESFIGERKHTNPPLVVDFREAFHRDASRTFDRGPSIDDVLMHENDCPVFQDILAQWDKGLGPERKKKLGIDKVSTPYDVVKIAMMLNDSEKFKETWSMFYRIATAEKAVR